MKIAFDAKRAFHNFRGLGNYGRTLIEGLVKYYPNNEYVLFTPPIKDPKGIEWLEMITQMGNVKVVTPEGFLSKLFPSAWRSLFLTKAIIKENPDIYHGLSHELPPKIDQTNIKTVVTIHDLLFMRFPKMFGAIDRRIYFKKFTHSCNVANRIVAICEQTKSDIDEYLHAPLNKVNVVYQSCDSRFYASVSDQQKEDVRKKYFLPHNFILYVGALTKTKNLKHLIKSYQYVCEEHDLPLVIVGKANEYRLELFNLACTLKLERHIIFLDYVPNSDLPALLQQAILFVFPSLFEGFGIPIIESFFSHTPVITSTGSCFRETGGDAACYVDPHDSETLGRTIARLVENNLLRNEMIEKGDAWVQQFHYEVTSQNLMEVYNSL